MCIVCVCVIVVRTDWSVDGAQCVRLHCLFFALGDSDDGICPMDGDDAVCVCVIHHLVHAPNALISLELLIGAVNATDVLACG